MIAACCWLLGFVTTVHAVDPDFILYHGKIITVDELFSVREAIAVQDGRILQVGPSAEVSKLRGPRTEVVDLKGRLVLPGLMDSHAHPADACLTEFDHAIPPMENIQDVPVSISTVSGEQLDALTSGGTDIRFLSGRVPSLNIESSFGRAFPRFYIRGYGNTDFRLNPSQPVSLVYDDVVQAHPILLGFPLFDLEQVEVLRGPQGSLCGRN